MGRSDTYEVRLYDRVLATFEFSTNDFGEVQARGFEFDAAARHLLPLNLASVPDDRELERWLHTRRIPKNRAYVEQILKPFGLSASDTKGIIDISRGASINDAYSVVPEGSGLSFADYNLFDNPFDKVLELIAYTGTIPPEALGAGIPSELSPSGTFPKTWRIVNGKRVLFKGSSAIKAANTGKEPYSEFFSSQVADAMGLAYVNYDVTEWQGSVCSTCELFNTKDISFVPFGFAVSREEFEGMNLERALSWFHRIGNDTAEAYTSMLVFDCVIANPDRHLGNYGVLRDNHSGEIVGLAPIFDNNLALFAHEMDGDLSLSFMNERIGTMTGAFNLALPDQALVLLGERQIAQLEKLADFELTANEFVRDKHAENPRSREAFPPDRVALLNEFVHQQARFLLESDR